jgi:hypothetical protein
MTPEDVAFLKVPLAFYVYVLIPLTASVAYQLIRKSSRFVMQPVLLVFGGAAILSAAALNTQIQYPFNSALFMQAVIGLPATLGACWLISRLPQPESADPIKRKLEEILRGDK